MEVCPVTSLQNNKPDPVLSSQAGWRENLWVPSVVLCQLCWEAFRRVVGQAEPWAENGGSSGCTFAP